MAAIYLHNPRCSKSRQGLEILKEKNVSVSVQEYLKEPLNKNQLENLYDLLSKNYEVKEFTRVKEKLFKELELSADEINTKAKWVKVINQNPIFLERPILLTKTKAIIGRPPEELIK